MALSLLQKREKIDYRALENIYYNLGYAFFHSGNYITALGYYKKSSQALEYLGDRGKGETFYSLGQTYFLLDSLEKAECYFYRAIQAKVRENGVNHYLSKGRSLRLYIVLFERCV